VIYGSKGGRVGAAGLPVIIPRLLSRGCWDEDGGARCVFGSAARRGGAQAADGGESKERVLQRYSTAGLSETGGGRAMALSDFDRSFKPISTRGTDYAHYITAYPPGFENLTASLSLVI
jgi:hypothetical protein